MSQTVIGIFERENEAQRAVENLVNQGFNREDVDLAMRDSSQTQTSTSHDQQDDGFGSSVSNFFSSLFGDDDDRSTSYSEVAKRGSTVTVHTKSESEAERAAEILDSHGAVDIDEKASAYRNNTGSSFSSGSEYNQNETTGRSIPVIEENLEVGKREVESGGARLRSRIVEKPVEESVRLRSERVNVERHPVNRQANEADFDTFREGTIEMTEHREVPVVGKEAWVKEEVSLNKEVEEREETVRDTVRRTEVDVENLDEDERYRDSRVNNSNSDDDFDDDNSLNRDRGSRL